MPWLALELLTSDQVTDSDTKPLKFSTAHHIHRYTTWVYIHESLYLCAERQQQGSTPDAGDLRVLVRHPNQPRAALRTRRAESHPRIGII